MIDVASEVYSLKKSKILNNDRAGNMELIDFAQDPSFYYYVFPHVCWDWLYVSKEWDRLARKQIEKNIAARPMGDYYWPLLWACMGGYKKLIRAILSHPDFVFPKKVEAKAKASDHCTASKLLKRKEKMDLIMSKLFLLGRDYLVCTGNSKCLQIFDEIYGGNAIVTFSESLLESALYHRRYIMGSFKQYYGRHWQLQHREDEEESEVTIKFIEPVWDIVAMLDQKIKACA